MFHTALRTGWLCFAALLVHSCGVVLVLAFTGAFAWLHAQHSSCTSAINTEVIHPAFRLNMSC
jgi:hypothetical protein